MHGARKELRKLRAGAQRLSDMIAIEISCHTGLWTHSACHLRIQQDQLVSIGDRILNIADRLGVPLELYPEQFFPQMVDLRTV